MNFSHTVNNGLFLYSTVILLVTIAYVVLVHSLEGFGNATRIDYGTGHELKFIAFLFCLMKIQAVPQSDAAAVVLRVCTK